MAQAFELIGRLVGPSLHVDVVVVTHVDAHAFGCVSSGHQTVLVLSDLHKHSTSHKHTYSPKRGLKEDNNIKEGSSAN